MSTVENIPVRLVSVGLFVTVFVTIARADDPDDRALFSDRPMVVIVQYESGRILVARQVNGELQVHEPKGGATTALGRYLQPAGVRQVHDPQERRAPAHHDVLNPHGPMFFNPAWFQRHRTINVTLPGGPGTARTRQHAAELRQQVKARRAEQDTAGVTNRTGQAYPSTAADAEEAERLARVQRESGGSPDVTFYSLGYGLDYYRQQEIAARAELSMLSYDALLDDGLRYFHQGRYGQAARAFIAASQKDLGDAGSRLHAGQALVSCGLYTEAMEHVRRAFELSPQLINRPLNHSATYTNTADYREAIETLRAYVRAHPDDADAAVLLAYELFFSEDPAQAAGAMKRVKALARSDRFAWRLYNAAKPMVGKLEE